MVFTDLYSEEIIIMTIFSQPVTVCVSVGVCAATSCFTFTLNLKLWSRREAEDKHRQPSLPEGFYGSENRQIFSIKKTVKKNTSLKKNDKISHFN